MRVQSFTSLFYRVNGCYRKDKHFTSYNSLLLTVRRCFSQWDLVGAVCLERKPVITQPLTPLEERYMKYIQKLEVEKSFLSEHEKRKIVEKRIEQKVKAGNLEFLDLVPKQTAQDFEDICIKEAKNYEAASRTSDADIKNDRHSTQRKLDSSLVLVINQKLGNEFKWALPQAIHKEGETLRQTAERALQQVATFHDQVQFMGNAPVGYYKYKYPKAIRGNGVCGAKVFFFKAILLNHEDSLVVNKSDIISDYLWLTHSELEEVLVPVLYKTVQSFLFPDVLVHDTVDDGLMDDNEQISSVGNQH